MWRSDSIERDRLYLCPTAHDVASNEVPISGFLKHLRLIGQDLKTATCTENSSQIPQHPSKNPSRNSCLWNMWSVHAGNPEVVWPSNSGFIECRGQQFEPKASKEDFESYGKYIREPNMWSNKWCLRRIRAHQGASRCINCVLFYRACFCKKDVHIYNISLDQLVRNADQLIPAKKRIEWVHRGASVAHHNASRFTLDTICSIPFSFPRV